MSSILPGLVWYKQEPLWRGPFQLCQPEKRNNCRRWKRFFVPRINLFTWLWRYWYISSCILCLIYQRSAKSKQPVSRVPILAKFSNDFWLNCLTFSPFQSLTAFFLNDSRQKKCWMRLTMIKKPDKAAHQQTWGHLFIYQFRWVAFQLGQPKGCAFEK